MEFSIVYNILPILIGGFAIETDHTHNILYTV